MADSAISPACRYFQSAAHTGKHVKTPPPPLGFKQPTPRGVSSQFCSICMMCCLMMGRMIFPPSPQAILSRALSPATALLQTNAPLSAGPQQREKRAGSLQGKASPVKVIVLQLVGHRPLLVILQVHHHRQHLRHWGGKPKTFLSFSA